MTISRISALIEKLFVLLLAGACSFMVAYLRDISASLDSMRGKVGVACEQISSIEAGMNSLKWAIDRHESELARQQAMFEQLHPRKG